MDFVSADRSRDAEFTRGLQNYNNSIFENNQELSVQIDKSKGDLEAAKDNATEVADLSNIKTTTQLSGIGAGAVARLATVTKVLKEAKSAKLAAEVAANRAGQAGVGAATRAARPGAAVAGAAGEIGSSAAARTARIGGSAAARAALPAAEQAAGEGLLEAGGKAVAKGALIAAKGAGLAGSALTAGSAIYGLTEGKKFKFSEQGAEIGGAVLDVIGTGLEFIPGGQLFGLGLMAAGTTLSTVGSVNEALDTDPTKQKEISAAEKTQAKTQADLESAKRQAVLGVTSAAQGSAAIGRQIQ
jgi:hypothetical protein